MSVHIMDAELSPKGATQKVTKPTQVVEIAQPVKCLLHKLEVQSRIPECTLNAECCGMHLQPQCWGDGHSWVPEVYLPAILTYCTSPRSIKGLVSKNKVDF